MADALPTFRYHPDPLTSGSVVESTTECACCHRARGYTYAGPVYSESDDLDDALCPWCIDDGSAHETFDATFVDSEAFTEHVAPDTMRTVTERTPGYSAWQSERWPVCCRDATAFVAPLGIDELRASHRELEGAVMSYIVYQLGISGGAATRMLESLTTDGSPTVYLFRCLACEQYHVHVDKF